MRIRMLLSLFLLAGLVSSCTFKIQARPPIGVTIYEDKLPYDAAVYIPPNVAELEVRQGGLCCVGVVHSFDVMVGDAVTTYSKKYFEGVFHSANVYHSLTPIKENEDIKVTIEPYVKNLRIYQDLKTEFELHTMIRDRQDMLIYERSSAVKTKTNEAMGKACIGGVMLAESGLRDSFTDALNQAFKELLTDIRSGNNWEKLKAVGQEQELQNLN